MKDMRIELSDEISEPLLNAIEKHKSIKTIMTGLKLIWKKINFLNVSFK